MKLRRFQSDWNGIKSDKAYNPKPTASQVKEAFAKGKVYSGDCIIFAKGYCVEVKSITGNKLAHNTYRDLYSVR